MMAQTKGDENVNKQEKIIKEAKEKASEMKILDVLDGLLDTPHSNEEIPFPYGISGPKPHSWNQNENNA
ncbi:MAG: hypothetical protein OXI87_25175 [Albidovulum sp.]|nr:hypothetical protein [Albidovulum sp.]